MPDTASSAPRAPRPSLVRKFLLAVVALVVLLLVLFFVATSSAFLKAMVLPRVGPLLGAKITADDVALSPFSQLVLTQPKVQTVGPEPLFAAQELRVRYNLLDILRGNITVPEVTVTAPTVQIVQNPDGTSNLDPILATLGAQKKNRPPKAPAPGKPLQLDVRHVALNQMTVRWVQHQKGGGQQSAELTNLQLGVDTVKNGQSGKLTLNADARFQQLSPSNGVAPNAISAKLAASYTFALDSALMPQSANGTLRFAVGQAAGTFGDLAALAGSLNCDLTQTEIRQLALQFTQSGRNLGQIRVSGPVDLAKTEAHLTLAVSSIDRHVLNLVGAARGWDFGQSVLNATSQVDVAQNASVISAQGKLSGRQLTLTQHGQSTPALDLDLDYHFTANLAGQTALIQKFALSARQNGADLLQAALDRPMQLSWGQNRGQFADSSWQLKLAGLDLRDWRPMLGNALPTGKVGLDLKLLAQNAGRRLEANLSARETDATVTLGTNRLTVAEMGAAAVAQIDDFKKISVSQFQIEVKQPGSRLATASGSANYDLGNHNLSAQANVEVSAPGALQLFPVPGVSASSGDVKLTARVNQQGPELDATGQLHVADFTGGYGNYQFQNLEPSADFDLALKGDQAQVKRLAITLQTGSTPAGRLESSGSYDLRNKSGRGDFKIAEVNQAVLGPVLGPKLAPTHLESVTFSASGTASYDPEGDSAVTADVTVANLLLVDPEHKLPRVPLGARLQVDGALGQQLVTVKKFSLTLSSGGLGGSPPRPGGNLDFAGQYDLGKKSAQANFKLTDLNQNVLGPFLGPRLEPNQLVSVSLSASGNASYAPQRDSATKLQIMTTDRPDASVQVQIGLTNLVVADPEHRLPQTPWGAQFHLDGALFRQQTLVLHQLRVALAPTARARNELDAEGIVDFSKAGATSGKVSLKADSLDLTPIYDLLMGPATTNATSRPAVAAASPPPAASPNSEPPAVNLPFEHFAADLNIGRLYLRDVAITNWIATAAINGGQVDLKPFQLTLNGAPVNATAALNLGVPGYTYDVSFQADKVPVQPLADSFSPTYAGQAKGDLFTKLQLKGAGVTGASLRQNLTCQASLSFTNAAIQLVSPKMNVLLAAIASLLRVSEITQAPLNSIYAQLEAGNGQIKLDQVGIESGTFHAYAQGTISIADVLTNSPLNHLPVNFYLERGIATRAHLLVAGTAPDAPFVKLPNFLKIGGTVGSPKAETDDFVITALIAGSAAGFVGGKAGGILQDVGNILSGGKPLFGAPATNAAPDTNQAPRVINPLNLLNNLFKK
ncbi:MAG: AsmA family protein [Verrucomicrobia bacterium]|nr:AsmA family protein [Verrucomicrobiota bacterium]